MSRYDDDYDDNEDERDDDDELDGEDGVRRSTSNPFSRPSSVRGAGLPQQQQPTTRPPNNADGSVPSPIRSGSGSGGSSGNSLLPNRSNNSQGGSSGGSGSNLFPNRSSNTPGGGNSLPPNRSSNTSGSGGGSLLPNNRPNPSQGNSPGGVQPYQRPSPGARPNDNDERGSSPNRMMGGSSSNDRRDERPSSSGGGGLGSFGSRQNDRDRDDNRSDERTSRLTSGLGGLTSRIGGDDKKDDAGKSGGGLGGLTSRFGGGDKKDDAGKSSSGGGLGSFGSRLGGGDKKDDKKSGGGLGGLTSRFGGGDKKDDAGKSSSGGGFGSRLGGGDKKDDKKSGGIAGGLGGLTSRFGGDKKDDAGKSSGGMSSSSSSGLGGSGSSFGSNRPAQSGSSLGGNRPGQSSGSSFGSGSSLGSSSSSTSRSSFGGSSAGSKPAGGKPAGASFSERLKGLNPFGKKEEQRPAPRSRSSKAPRVDQGGLTLDNKLDILGVSLLLGSLVLLLSSLSPTKGALTESINHGFSYLFGWGAVAVLLVIFAVGVWLILRHFGDEAPVISRTRLIGLAMLFVGVLVAAQFVDAFQYRVGANQNYLHIIKTVFLPTAYDLGRGGGWIGGEIYFQLLSNFGEIGGFMVVVGWLIVSLMLTLSLSASDLAMVVASNARNLSDVVRQRRQQAAAQRAAKQQALAAAAQQISVSKPAEAVPLTAGAGAASPALPAPTQEAQLPDQRQISITTGGRTSSIPFRAAQEQELVELQAAPPAATAASGTEKTGLLGGFGSRVRAAIPAPKLPIGKAADDKTETEDKSAAEKAASLRGRLFSRETTVSGESATASSAPERSSVAGRLGSVLKQNLASVALVGESAEPETIPAASASTAPAEVSAPAATATHAAETERPRLGDLLGRGAAATPGGVQPYQRPPLSRPDAAKPAEEPTASPSGAPPGRPETPIPDLQSRMRALRENAEAPKPAAAAPPAEMPPAATTAASPAYGKPVDPPFAIPQRTPSPEIASGTITRSRPPRNWEKPDPADLLSAGVDQEADKATLVKRVHIIEETLASFGAPGRVVDVRTGPVVTQFGVEPDYVPGRGGKKNRVKVGAIAALDKDLQLALGAKAIRIEAPVPGKGYVGVEVPNEKPETVHLRDVLESPEFKKIRSPLAIALGQGVDGTPVAADLASMPHLLIAGTTGSGKSVCVNAVIASILLNNSPRQVKFVMVDPKRVELTQYNGIPHLIAPVVVELERIVSVLKWVTREMDERYRKFSNAAARNIEDYNKHLPATEEPLPYIVVIIDELADLMMLAPDDTERTITRIAALARATGIHLVIATQRPSVDVVTGLIKANFPARIAFAVAGNTDSRVILDQPGAERLLGRGDMLYMSGDAPAPVRLQGVFVSDKEISNITHFWRSQMTEADMIAAARPTGMTLAPEDAGRSVSGGVIMRNSSAATKPQEAFWDEDDDSAAVEDDDSLGDGEDEMYEQAVDLVRRLNKASVSLLQRRLRIGYTRAARLIDTMEERGVIGPPVEGAKPREVLPVR